MSSLRSLPRLFLPGAKPDESFELPADELNKLRHVLRLSSGAQIAVLPGDGTLIRCELRGHSAVPIEVATPDTEPSLRLTIAQAFPKGDKLDEIVKACTGLGVARFLFFPSERSVVQWDDKKKADRLRRLKAIAREEAEVCFRTRLPECEMVGGLKEVLDRFPEAAVLSEVEGLDRRLSPGSASSNLLIVGPEGGWSPREILLIGDRGVSLGPRVLRVEYAAAAASALLLLA